MTNNPNKDVKPLENWIKMDNQSSHLQLIQKIPGKTASEKVKHLKKIADESKAQKDTIKILSASKTRSATSLEVVKLIQKPEKAVESKDFSLFPTTEASWFLKTDAQCFLKHILSEESIYRRLKLISILGEYLNSAEQAGELHNDVLRDFTTLKTWFDDFELFDPMQKVLISRTVLEKCQENFLTSENDDIRRFLGLLLSKLTFKTSNSDDRTSISSSECDKASKITSNSTICLNYCLEKCSFSFPGDELSSLIATSEFQDFWQTRSNVKSFCRVIERVVTRIEHLPEEFHEELLRIFFIDKTTIAMRQLDVVQRYFINCYINSADGDKLIARLKYWSELLKGFFQHLSRQSQIPVGEIVWIVDVIKKCLSTANVNEKSKILLVEWTLKAFNSVLSPEQAPYFYLILTYLRVLDADVIYPEVARKIAKILPVLITFFSLEFLELIAQTLSEILDFLYPGSKNVILNILVCLVKFNNEMIENFSVSSSNKKGLITPLDDESYKKIFATLQTTSIDTKK